MGKHIESTVLIRDKRTLRSLSDGRVFAKPVFCAAPFEIEIDSRLNMANPEYMVPKLSVEAEIAFPRQPHQQVKIFLSDHAPSHSGYERPSDLLNQEETFLPSVAADGELLLLHLESLMVVELDAEHEFDENLVEVEANSLSGAVEFHLDVGLADGSVRSGLVNIILPRAQRRVQNVLNGDERFVALREGPRVCFVNKNHITWVREAADEE